MDIDLPKTSAQPTNPPVQDVGAKQDNSAVILPSAAYEHLNSDGVIEALLGLEEEFTIPSDKTGVLPFFIGAIINGELAPADLVQAIQEGLGTSKENALKMAGVIKEKVLNPIAAALLIAVGVDVEPIPGASAKDTPDLPGLVKELDPYLKQYEKAEAPAGGVTPKAKEQLEPLVAGPRSAAAEQRVPGMEMPGLRVMKDVKPPAAPVLSEIKKPEPAQPTPAPKIVAAPRPFMLHEEKPILPNEPTSLKVNQNFSFDVGETSIRKTAPRPVAAELNSSFDSMLEQKKPAAPVTAKTVETPKVVHYTSMRTPLGADETPKN
jgi:hypothetical protein